MHSLVKEPRARDELYLGPKRDRRCKLVRRLRLPGPPGPQAAQRRRPQGGKGPREGTRVVADRPARPKASLGRETRGT